MEQEKNNTFQYINNEENNIVENITTISENNEEINKTITEDFVTGLPPWDLEPPYEVIRRVNR